MSEGLLHRLRRIFAPAPDEGEAAAYRVRLIVGLGNPGKEYGGNRHNVGFWVVNRLARRHGIDFKVSGQAALAQGKIAGRQVALAKPRTFVNESGRAVWNLVKRLKLDDELLAFLGELLAQPVSPTPEALDLFEHLARAYPIVSEEQVEAVIETLRQLLTEQLASQRASDPSRPAAFHLASVPPSAPS